MKGKIYIGAEDIEDISNLYKLSKEIIEDEDTVIAYKIIGGAKKFSDKIIGFNIYNYARQYIIETIDDNNNCVYKYPFNKYNDNVYISISKTRNIMVACYPSDKMIYKQLDIAGSNFIENKKRTRVIRLRMPQDILNKKIDIIENHGSKIKNIKTKFSNFKIAKDDPERYIEAIITYQSKEHNFSEINNLLNIK